MTRRRPSYPFTLVTRFLIKNQIEVQFDGSLVRRDKLQCAETPAMVAAYLKVDHLTERDLVDQILLSSRGDPNPPSISEIAAATRQVLKRKKHKRLRKVMFALLQSPQPVDIPLIEQQWKRLGTLFDMNPDLAIAIIKHFIWQVQQKTLGRPVTAHLMPIIFGRQQGSGKTTFVRHLVSPLQELASGDAVLSDFSNRRSADIYRYPVVVIDDMERIDKADVPILKALVTSKQINRRRLHSSGTVSMRQNATLIGTANTPVDQLIADPTGHRRFVMQPFRDGNVPKGGSPDIWETVNSLDYVMLWRSVDAFAQSPIQPYLSDLHAYQSGCRPEDPMLTWLLQLDLGSEDLRSITTQDGVKADGLRNLYMAATNDQPSRQKFADAMDRHMMNPRVPFRAKKKKEYGAVYVIRRPTPAA